MTNSGTPETSQEEVLRKAQKAFHDADLLSETGHAEDAVEALTQALDLYRGLPGTEQSQALCLGSTGFNLYEMGRYTDAFNFYVDAQEIYPQPDGGQ